MTELATILFLSPWKEPTEMFQRAAFIIILAGVLGNVANAEGPPLIRPGECLVTYDRVATEYLTMTIPEAALAALEQKIANDPSSITDDEVTAERLRITETQFGYEIFQSSHGDKSILVAYVTGNDFSYTTIRVDFSNEPRQSVSVKGHFGRDNWLLRHEIEWKDDDSFSLSTSSVELDDEGLLARVYKQPTLLGNIRCLDR